MKYADALWKKMEQADFVGDGAVKTVPYEGQHPRGAVLEPLYGEVAVKGHTGELIGRRNYGGEGITNAKVAKNRKEYLGAGIVMFKRGPGYDPENNNWFWVKCRPDGSLATNPKGMKLAGRVAKGADKGCIACHSSQKDNDFQFNTTEFITKQAVAFRTPPGANSGPGRRPGPLPTSTSFLPPRILSVRSPGLLPARRGLLQARRKASETFPVLLGPHPLIRAP